MKIDKFLYFRQVTDEASDGLQSANASNENPASLLVPASSLCAMHPTGDTTLSLYFKPVRAIYGAAETIRDRVDLTVTEGDIFEVMSTITAAINAGPHSDGFITIADDAITTDSATSALNDLAQAAVYIHPSITACAAIVVQSGSAAGYGVHEYFEVVSPMAADDDDVAASLSIKLPAQAIITDAALVAVELAGTNHGLLGLEVHNAAVADDAASGGTEIIGEDVAGNVSVPDNDLDLDAAAGVLGSVITMGTLANVQRGTDETFFHVTAKEDLSSMTGTPKVGVYVKYIGGAPILL